MPFNYKQNEFDKNRSDQPLFGGNFKHHLRQFETGSVDLLLLGAVGTVQRAFFLHQRGKKEQKYKGHHEEPAHRWHHDFQQALGQLERLITSQQRRDYHRQKNKLDEPLFGRRLDDIIQL